MSEHPTPAELEAFIKGNLPLRRFPSIARHLLRRCSTCISYLAPYYRSLLSTDSVADEEIFNRTLMAFRCHRRYLRLEGIRQRKVANLFEGGGGWEALVKSEIPLRGLGALKALLDQIWGIRHENLNEMVRLARQAVEVSGRLDPRWHSKLEVADWQARAWGECGNALRASDDLDEAERAFGIAFEFLLQGTGDAHLKARLHDLYASYLGTRRAFDLAFTALDIVHATYLELGDAHLAGKALVTKAIYLHYSGQSEQALVVNQLAMSSVDFIRDPSLIHFSIHNQIWFLISCGKFVEAKKELFRRSGSLYAIDGRINKIRLRWLQAQVNAGLKEWLSAEQGLLQVKEGFEEEGMGFHAALASLDLALVWMHQDRYEETEKMVIEVADVFVALRIQREAFGAIMVLKEAFEREMATLGLLKDVVEFLRRWYLNPNERFLPPEE